MNYSDLIKYDMINGIGVRVSLFVSGCDHGCRGCFNKKTWNKCFGNEYTKETEDLIIRELQDTNHKRDGLTLLGGDPLFSDNVETVIKLCKRVKAETNKNIWLWTGYTLEEIKSKVELREILKYTDVIIDGKFEEDKKDLSLKWRGSSNQRVLKRGEDY